MIESLSRCVCCFLAGLVSRFNNTGKSVTSWAALILVKSDPVAKKYLKIFSKFFYFFFRKILIKTYYARSYPPQHWCSTGIPPLEGQLSGSRLSKPFGRVDQKAWYSSLKVSFAVRESLANCKSHSKSSRSQEPSESWDSKTPRLPAYFQVYFLNSPMHSLPCFSRTHFWQSLYALHLLSSPS